MIEKRRSALWVRLLVLGLLVSLAGACGPSQETSESSSAQEGGPACPYKLPLSTETGPIEISQGYAEPDNYSHHEGSLMEYAIDFSLPEGTPVLATRTGKVSDIHEGEYVFGGPETAKNANYVIIDHGDGVFSLYLHLQARLEVEKGQRVQQGQVIGHSGKTGWTNGNPHLHYQLQEKGVGFGRSIPLCFQEVKDKIPKVNYAYTSKNQPIMVQAMQVTKEPENSCSIHVDRSNPHEVAQQIICAVSSKNVDILAGLLGSNGASYAPPGTMFQSPGYDALTPSLQEELRGSNPNCAGYLHTDRRVEVFFNGINLTSEHLFGYNTKTVLFLAMKMDGEDKYQLVAAVPTPKAWLKGLDMYPCE